MRVAISKERELHEKIRNMDEIIECHRGEQRMNEEKDIYSIEQNLKFIFYVNKSKKKKQKIGPLKVGEKYKNNPKKICEMLIDQYKSLFSKKTKQREDR